jgi:hypothetical protein
MSLPASGPPQFSIDAADRVYAGLNAAVIDHPGNAARIELGLRPSHVETRTIGDQTVTYAEGGDRDFAVFVPGQPTADPLQPTLAIEADGTQIRGNATVHGNLVLDGAALQFPEHSEGRPASISEPAIYRTNETGADELRIDIGSLDVANRRFVIGASKDGKFVSALEITFADAAGPTPRAIVTVIGDLRIEGTIKSPDVRTRTVTEEVAALLTGMVQAGIAAGGS